MSDEQIKAMAEEIVREGGIRRNTPYSYGECNYLAADEMVAMVIKKHIAKAAQEYVLGLNK